MIDIRLRADTAPLRLLADRALYWPAQDCLVLADVHLGKGDVFRRQGLAVPAGASVSDLSRIDALLAACGARRLLVLGDLVHAAPPERRAPWVAAVQDWRARHTELDLWLVVGNHDRAPRRLASLLGLELLDEGTPLGGLRLWHDAPAEDTEPGLGGHIHPALHWRGGARQRLRLPVFWQRGAQLILPAFGGLTGGYAIRPQAGDRVWAAGPDTVAALPLPAP